MQKMSILQNNDGRCMLNICSVPIYMPISSVKYQMMSNHLGAGKPYGRWRITTGNTKQTLFSCQGPKLIWSKVQVVHRETVVITETNEYYDQSKRKNPRGAQGNSDKVDHSRCDRNDFYWALHWVGSLEATENKRMLETAEIKEGLTQYQLGQIMLRERFSAGGNSTNRLWLQ